MLRTPVWHARLPPCCRFLRSRLPRPDSTLRQSTDSGRSFATESRSRTAPVDRDDSSHPSKEVKQRTAELAHARPGGNNYPRWSQNNTLAEYSDVHKEPVQTAPVSASRLSVIRRATAGTEETRDSTGDKGGPQAYHVAGRITAIRTAGKYLAFIDIQSDGKTLQVKLNHGQLPDVTHQAFQQIVRILRRGDHISAKGTATLTKAGLPALQAVELPMLCAPCLQRLPVPKALAERDLDREATVDRHVEMLTYPSMIDTLKVRSYLIDTIRSALNRDGFLEVQTPILGADAGGATARPFITTATEFSERKLSLRIAPELWLKRLMVGGLTQVFEIGPSFRNEGLDKVHNPEFTTCEFYAAYLDIARLTRYTERLFGDIAKRIETRATPGSFDESIVSEWRLGELESFPKLDFIPTINATLGVDLPDLATPSARDQILDLFREKAIPVPPTPTLPRLLDALCAHYIEPQCQKPTWIVNTPECLSPLSKSFTHPTAANSQRVAARAELFMRGKEVVNCYEEENSPIEQREKFVDQQRYARLDNDNGDGGSLDEEAMQVDEDYIRALEWGLPPTGGWGCGIDRLVMLATGSARIGDVLSFGNLRAVTRSASKVEK